MMVDVTDGFWSAAKLVSFVPQKFRTLLLLSNESIRAECLCRGRNAKYGCPKSKGGRDE